jgi:TatD DNase family protein
VLTDTHCHLDSEAFHDDLPAVIERARQAGVRCILAPGIDLTSSQNCVRLASENADIYAAVGIHPTDEDLLQPNTLENLRALAHNARVVAIGEIGLDYYWVLESWYRTRQQETLQAQLRLAGDLGKPVVLHCREQGDTEGGPCMDDLLDILGQWLQDGVQKPPNPGVLHSFSGDLASARRAIDLGFLIGVTGPVTYRNAASRRALIGALPLESLLIETDAPYLAPHPHRGKRNEPAYVTHIADKIAEIQSRQKEEVAAVTSENAARLFLWGETA